MDTCFTRCMYVLIVSRLSQNDSFPQCRAIQSQSSLRVLPLFCGSSAVIPKKQSVMTFVGSVQRSVVKMIRLALIPADGKSLFACSLDIVGLILLAATSILACSVSSTTKMGIVTATRSVGLCLESS